MILDQFGNVVAPAKPKKSLERPLTIAPMREGYREYPADYLTPEKISLILKESDMGVTYYFCDFCSQMKERYPHFLSEWEKRRNVIGSANFTLGPADGSGEAEKIYSFVKKVLNQIPRMQEVQAGLQDAIGMGFSGQEILWDVSSGQAIPKRFTPIDPRRFVFFSDGKDGGISGVPWPIPRLITDTDMIGEPVPAWKMLFRKYANHPYRDGLFRICAKMYLFFNYALTDWAIFNEHFGMPYIYATFEQDMDQNAKDALYQAVSNLSSGSKGIIPKGAELKFEMPSQGGGGAGDNFESMALFCNAQVSKVLLGQTLSADTGGGHGSYAMAKIHDGVRKDLLYYDAVADADCFRDEVIKPLVGFNFGWDAAEKLLPTYTGEVSELDDMVKGSMILLNLLKAGLKVDEEYVYKAFAYPKPAKDATLLKPVNLGGGSGSGAPDRGLLNP